MSTVKKSKCDQCDREVRSHIVPPDWITLNSVYIGGRRVSKDDGMRDCLDFCNRKCLNAYLDTHQEER